MDHPTEIKEGMVFALETYCPAKDGYSAARIEEEVVVTDKGHTIISLFPAEGCRSRRSTDRLICNIHARHARPCAGHPRLT